MRLRSTLAANLVELRRERGFSQEQLARLLKCNKQTVWRLESALTNATTDMLESLGRALSCEPAALLAQEPDGDDERLDEDLRKLEKVLTCLGETTRLARSFRLHLHIKKMKRRP